MRKPAVVAALLVGVLIQGTPAWAVAPDLSIDQGVIERGWISNSKPKTDDVLFAWIPSSSLADVELFLLGECLRRDGFGLPVGGHKVTFKNIELLGVDSGNSVLAQNAVARLRDGVQNDQVVWVLTDSARGLFANDSSILVSGQIKVSKRLDPFDILTCALGVLELSDLGGSPIGGAPQGAEGMLPVVRGLDLPRVLKSARP